MLMNGLAPTEKRQWFNFLAADGDTQTIRIYDSIGGFMGIGADEFTRSLDNVTASNIALHINSPGGSVFEGITIANALKNHPANVTTYIDGVAASIASIIAIRGADRVISSDSGFLMIHNPFAMAIGDSSEMLKMAETLEKIRETLANNYVAKSGKDIDEIYQMMDEETWLDANAALEAGLIDEIQDSSPAASNKFDFAAFSYKNVPDAVKSKVVVEPQPQPKTDPEPTPEPEIDDSWKALVAARQRNLALAEYEI